MIETGGGVLLPSVATFGLAREALPPEFPPPLSLELHPQASATRKASGKVLFK
jgi:hypothetical protein